jgi:hypothetical protein
VSADDSGHDAFLDDPSVVPADDGHWLEDPAVDQVLASIAARPAWGARSQALRDGREEVEGILQAVSLPDLLSGIDALAAEQARMLLALRLVLDRARELATDAEAARRFWDA